MASQRLHGTNRVLGPAYIDTYALPGPASEATHIAGYGRDL